MLNVANCIQCGKLCAKSARNLCAECMKKIEKQYERCAEYLRENRGATMHELSTETGVSVSQIVKFIHEGRISTLDATGLEYPCEACGEMIRSQKLCDSCRMRLRRGWEIDNGSAAANESEANHRPIYEIKTNRKL